MLTTESTKSLRFMNLNRVFLLNSRVNRDTAIVGIEVFALSNLQLNLIVTIISMIIFKLSYNN